MRIIPVLDLMQGQVVQGIRGERERYRPIQSVLTPKTDPLSVAQALEKETNCRQFYIADLDALRGQGHQGDIIRGLAAELGTDLWVDAGINDATGALKILTAGAKVIACSEAIPNLAALGTIKKALPQEDVLFSIDIAKGRVLSRCASLRGLDPLEALELLAQQGWSRFILLTLDRVGTGGGPDWRLLEAASHRFGHLSLIAGGGVRKPDDIRPMAGLGLNGVLVSTALHRGWITGRDLRSVGLGQ